MSQSCKWCQMVGIRRGRKGTYLGTYQNPTTRNLHSLNLQMLHVYRVCSCLRLVETFSFLGPEDDVFDRQHLCFRHCGSVTPARRVGVRRSGERLHTAGWQRPMELSSAYVGFIIPHPDIVEPCGTPRFPEWDRIAGPDSSKAYDPQFASNLQCLK